MRQSPGWTTKPGRGVGVDRIDNPSHADLLDENPRTRRGCGCPLDCRLPASSGCSSLERGSPAAYPVSGDSMATWPGGHDKFAAKLKDETGRFESGNCRCGCSCREARPDEASDTMITRRCATRGSKFYAVHPVHSLSFSAFCPLRESQRLFLGTKTGQSE